ncbi:MAG: transporter substrate-binding domain-containing protein [Spirochaetaceae bacterium]|jgi:ABC-type amino acid transport substrate-binding protein|nr:transporter substrate-binding domain-containing protein [Spirochaetaceae bacterium]
MNTKKILLTALIILIAATMVFASPQQDAAKKYVLLWQGEPDELFGIGLKKGNDGLTQALNKALGEFFEDGTLVKLSEKYLEGDKASMAKGFSGTAISGDGGAIQLVKPGELSIGMEISYPPFEYMADDGKTPMGFDVDLGKMLAEKLGLKPVYVNTGFDGIFAGVDKGDYDCVISAATMTEARLATGNWTRPYIANALSLVGIEGSKTAPKSPEECAGLQVAYQAETTADYYMQDLADKGLSFTPREYDSIMSAFDDLKLGRVDVVIVDSTVADSYLGK